MKGREGRSVTCDHMNVPRNIVKWARHGGKCHRVWVRSRMKRSQSLETGSRIVAARGWADVAKGYNISARRSNKIWCAPGGLPVITIHM